MSRLSTKNYKPRVTGSLHHVMLKVFCAVLLTTPYRLNYSIWLRTDSQFLVCVRVFAVDLLEGGAWCCMAVPGVRYGHSKAQSSLVTTVSTGTRGAEMSHADIYSRKVKFLYTLYRFLLNHDEMCMCSPYQWHDMTWLTDIFTTLVFSGIGVSCTILYSEH